MAWAAGLFEGEGSAVVVRSTQRGRLQLGSCDLDVLERFRDVVEGGFIAGPYRDERFPDGKPHWRWAAGRHRDVVRIARLLLPHLGLRRRGAIETMLAAIGEASAECVACGSPLGGRSDQRACSKACANVANYQDRKRRAAGFPV